MTERQKLQTEGASYGGATRTISMSADLGAAATASLLVSPLVTLIDR